MTGTSQHITCNSWQSMCSSHMCLLRHPWQPARGNWVATPGCVPTRKCANHDVRKDEAWCFADLPQLFRHADCSQPSAASLTRTRQSGWTLHASPAQLSGLFCVSQSPPLDLLVNHGQPNLAVCMRRCHHKGRGVVAVPSQSSDRGLICDTHSLAILPA